MEQKRTQRARSAPQNPAANRRPAARAYAQRRASANAPAQRPAPARPRPAAASRGGARRAQPSRHGNRNNSRKRLIGLAILAIVIALLWYLLDTMITLGVGQERFYNVYVNGVSLRGYTREEGYALFDTIEENWKNTSYELYYGDASWTFSPSTFDAELNEEDVLERAWNFGRVGRISSRKQLVKSLNDQPYSFESDITYDEAKVQAFIDTMSAAIDKEPVDAVVAAEVSGPRVVVESEEGVSLLQDDTLDLLKELLIYGSEQARVELPVQIISPALSTEEAEASLGNGDPIAECVTSIEGSRSNRKHNVRTALSRFNGLKVEPGETVSFNAVALERTVANGYKEAIEYSEGENTTGIGGGTCQASTTLYGALLRAGVTIVERHNHSMTVGYCNPSGDAAVTDSGSKDLVFRNDSEAPIYIYTSVTDTQAIVRIYGVRPEYRYEFRSIVTQDNIMPSSESVRVDTTGEYATYTDEKVLVEEGKPGRRSELWRDSYDWETGELVDSVQISSDYYSPGKDIYYVGIQERTGVLPSSSATAGATTNDW